MFTGLFKRNRKSSPPQDHILTMTIPSSSASTISLNTHILATTAAAPPAYTTDQFDYLLVKPRKPSFRRHFAKQIRCGYKRVKQAILHPSSMFKAKEPEMKLPDYFPESAVIVSVEQVACDEKPPAYESVFGPIHPLFIDSKPSNHQDESTSNAESNTTGHLSHLSIDITVNDSDHEETQDQQEENIFSDIVENDEDFGLDGLFDADVVEKVITSTTPSDWVIDQSHSYELYWSIEAQDQPRYSDNNTINDTGASESADEQDYFDILNDDPFDYHLGPNGWVKDTPTLKPALTSNSTKPL